MNKIIQKRFLCLMLAVALVVGCVPLGGIKAKAADTVSVSGATYPDWIKKGGVFILKGTVRSSSNITSLTASLCDSGGKPVYSKTVYPNRTSYDLRGIDAAMRFDRLPENPYTYRVVAKNATGTYNVIVKAFTVYTGTKPGFATLNTSKKYKLCVKEDSSMVVDIASGQATANVLVKKDVGQSTAGWYAESCGDGSYMLKNADTGLYLDVAHGYCVNGSNVWIWTKNGSNAQRWYFINDGGAYKIIAKNSHLTLSLERSVAENKPNVDLWRDIKAAHQRFYLTEMQANAGSGDSGNSGSSPVPAASSLAVSGANQVPTLSTGQKYSLKGTVTSNYPIKKVCAQILTSNGKCVVQKIIYPNATSVSLSGEIDRAMTFNTLPAGTYYYVVSAEDASGTGKTLIRQQFQVKAQEKKSKMLSINWNHIARVGKQASGSDSCMCFALAYCRTILDGRVYSWSDFDYNRRNNQYNASGWFGKANYNNKTTRSQAVAFRAAYDSINAGKPAIFWVTGRRSTQHFVAVVGYQNVTSPDSLSAENFLIIDPAPGTATRSAENMKKVGYSLKKNESSQYRYLVAR